MLEPLLKGSVEWCYELIIAVMSYFSKELLGVMGMDLAYFEKTAPVISEIVDVFVALGWALLIGNLVFQSVKAMMSGAGFEAEDPKIVFLRTFVFAFLLMASRQICEIGLNITATVIQMLKIPATMDVIVPEESLFVEAGAVKWIIARLVGLILTFQLLKLLLNIGERYILTGVLTFLSPLAFAMGGSKNTADIFKGWCRMYCTMLFMVVINIVFLKLILSSMSQMMAGGIVIWLVFVWGLTKAAKKIDTTIAKIGLNVAQTGSGGVGSRIPGAMTMLAVRVMASSVSSSLSSGKNGADTSDLPKHKRSDAGSGGTSFAKPTADISVNQTGGAQNGINQGTENSVGASTVYLPAPQKSAQSKAGQPNPNQNLPRTETVNGSVLPAHNTQDAGKAVLEQHSNNTVKSIQQKNTLENTGNSHQNSEFPLLGEKTMRPPLPRNTDTRDTAISGQTPSNTASEKRPFAVHPNLAGHRNGVQNRQGNIPASYSTQNEEINQSFSDNVYWDGKMSGSENVTQNRSENKNDMRKNGNIYGGDNRSTEFSGNRTEQSQTNTYFGSEQYSEQNKSAQSRNRTDFREQHINHEYKQGKYNPAAVNKKVKNSQYYKENVKQFKAERGDRNKKHKRQK